MRKRRTQTEKKKRVGLGSAGGVDVSPNEVRKSGHRHKQLAEVEKEANKVKNNERMVEMRWVHVYVFDEE